MATLTLNDLIPRYYLNKSELDSYKKLVDADNTAIKEILLKNLAKGETSVSETVDDLVATIKVIDKTDFDYNKLLQKLKSDWFEQHGSMTCPYVKTIETVNMEAVEDALYNGQLDAKALEGCKVPKVENRLTVKRSKKKKDEVED